MQNHSPDLPQDPAPIHIEPGPELDLHTFRASEIGDLIPDWLDTCRAKGILRVRIIHGKGTGTLREGVHRLLSKLPGIEQIVHPCAPDSGSWGATLVLLSEQAKSQRTPRHTPAPPSGDR